MTKRQTPRWNKGGWCRLSDGTLRHGVNGSTIERDGRDVTLTAFGLVLCGIRTQTEAMRRENDIAKRMAAA